MEDYFRVLLHGSRAPGQSGEGKSLSVEECENLTNELLEAYSAKAFQESIWNVRDSSKAADIAKLCMPVHKKVIEKYGFETSDKGVLHSQMAFTPEMHQHPEIAEKHDLMQYLLDADVQRRVADKLGKQGGALAPKQMDALGDAIPKGVFRGRAEYPSPKDWPEDSSGKVWIIVGGGDKGGIIVRRECETSSPQLNLRLSTGATVEEIERQGERLKYSKITGEGPDIGWVSTEAKGNLLCRPFLESSFSISTREVNAKAKTFKVIHDRVVQRATPSKDGNMVGAVLKDAIVKGIVVQEGEVPWLKVTDGQDEKFMMIEGSSMGLGLLLEEIEEAKPKNFTVVHDRVAQRDKPSKDGTMVGALTKGAVVKGTVVKIDDVDWLLVKEKAGNKYMMVDGASVGLGILLEETDLVQSWKVVHDRVAQRAEPTKEGTVVGAAVKGTTLKGKRTSADGFDWLIVEEKGDKKYMMIDGTSIGLGTLLERER